MLFLFHLLNNKQVESTSTSADLPTDFNCKQKITKDTKTFTCRYRTFLPDSFTPFIPSWTSIIGSFFTQSYSNL